MQPTTPSRRPRPVVRGLVALGLVLVLAIGGFGVYLAGVAGDLPWQTDPTRVVNAITPFAGIPGFGDDPTEPPAATPGPSSVASPAATTAPARSPAPTTTP